MNKLDQLADFYAQRDALQLQQIELTNACVPEELKAQMEAVKARQDEIAAEFADKHAAVASNIAALEAEIKADVLAGGKTVKGQFLMAVWSKGRVSWDTKALDGFAAAHPEIATFRKEGEPSVSIRKV